MLSPELRGGEHIAGLLAGGGVHVEVLEEHFRRAYRCPAGVWTVGYGHTSGVVPGTVITVEQAEEFLRQDIGTAEGIVNAECLNLCQCQFDALVSFVFNVGGGNFRKSTLLMKVKADPDDNSIMDEFLRWVYTKGKVLPGLQKRRLAEMKLYFSES